MIDVIANSTAGIGIVHDVRSLDSTTRVRFQAERCSLLAIDENGTERLLLALKPAMASLVASHKNVKLIRMSRFSIARESLVPLDVVE